MSELEEDVLGLAWLSPSVLLAASASAVHVLDTDEGGAEACCLAGRDFMCFSLALAAPLLAIGTAEPKARFPFTRQLCGVERCLQFQ